MDFKFIPTRIHGALDYIVAIALILAPMLFGFQEIGGAAVVVPMVLGVGLFVYSLFTNYEWGIFRFIGMSYHSVIDILASVLLIASPYLFGFIDQAPNVWLPHIAVGIAVILVVLFSQSRPSSLDVA